jgi:hypothetical protein
VIHLGEEKFFIFMVFLGRKAEHEEEEKVRKRLISEPLQYLLVQRNQCIKAPYLVKSFSEPQYYPRDI